MTRGGSAPPGRSPGPIALLRAGLVPAALLGAVAGALAGWPHLAAGFPLVTLSLSLSGLAWAAAGGAALLVVYAWLVRPLERRLAPWLATALALAVAAAPWVALGGYHLQRRWGIRPADVLASRSLRLNFVYLGLCALALAALGWLLARWRRRGAPRPRRRWALALAVAVAALALALAVAWRTGAGEGGAKPRPDVLVLLIDALRADHLSAYGHGRPTTPAIDSLAADGVLFRDAVAASTFTKSSIASLFTGRFPYQHGVYWGSRRLDDGSVVADLLPPAETTIAEALRERGWLTRAWVQNSHLVARMGFDQGFVDYRDSQGAIGRIHRGFFRFLRGPGRHYPYFAYLHYIDLHDPYRPAPPYDTMFGDGADPYEGIDLAEWGGYLEAVRRGEVEVEPERLERLRAAYDGQLRAIDDQIDRLLDELRALDLYDQTLIVITSDHGDAFGEHGFIAHSTVPYEELVRVPLIVKLPKGRFAGREVTEQVRLVDLMPTVLAAAGVEPPEGVAGCNLLPLVRGGGLPADCGKAVIEIAEEGAYPIAAVRTGRWKYIHHEHRDDELYDLVVDPGERTNLLAGGAEGETAAELAPEVEDLRLTALAAVAARGEGGDQMELDEALLQELKALGYLD